MSPRPGRVPPQVGIPTEPLRLMPPLFVEAPPEKRDELLAALRALFRDHIEERLACGSETSINGHAMPGDDAQ